MSVVAGSGQVLDGYSAPVTAGEPRAPLVHSHADHVPV